MKLSLLNVKMMQLAGDFITVWFMKFVIFLSRGWFNPNWALRRIAVHSVREKSRKKRHHNSTIIVLTHFLVTTPIYRRHAFTWSPCRRRWSQPRFLYSGELFLVKSTAYHGLLSGKCRYLLQTWESEDAKPPMSKSPINWQGTPYW